jgi:hypothetical protein
MSRFIIGLEGDDFVQNKITIIDRVTSQLFKLEINQFVSFLQKFGEQKTIVIDLKYYNNG